MSQISGALGSFLGIYAWSLWQWNGICGPGSFLLMIAFILHFSHLRSLKIV